MKNNVMQNNDHEDESNTVISIPVSKKELGSFICQLLGQKQSLERTYDVTFEIDHSWLMNLHEMIDQRISQQANSNLINFTAVVYFNNGAKRTLTTIEAFRGYNETKPEVSNGIKIIWEYLVQFPSSPHPEKQQISFTAHVYDRKSSEKKLKSLDLIVESLILDNKESLLNIQIDHTERTWGDDIENIISSYVSEVSDSADIKSIFVLLSRVIMIIIILGYMFFYPLYNAVTINSDVLVDLHDKYEVLKEITDVNVELINQKIDTVFNAIVRVESNKSSSTLWLLASTIFGPFIALSFLFITRSSQQSYILLSSKARILKEKSQKKNKTKVIIIALSYVASILAGIIGNYGFNFLNG